MLVYPLYFFVLFAFEISQPSATRLTMTLPFFAGFLLRPHRAVFYKSHFQEDLCACQNVDVSQNTRPLEAADADEAKLLCSISIMIDFIFSLRLYSFLFSFFFASRCAFWSPLSGNYTISLHWITPSMSTDLAQLTLTFAVFNSWRCGQITTICLPYKVKPRTKAAANTQSSLSKCHKTKWAGIIQF